MQLVGVVLVVMVAVVGMAVVLVVVVVMLVAMALMVVVFILMVLMLLLPLLLRLVPAKHHTYKRTHTKHFTKATPRPRLHPASTPMAWTPMGVPAPVALGVALFPAVAWTPMAWTPMASRPIGPGRRTFSSGCLDPNG